MPQGGGDHATGPRCTGECATIELLQASIGALRRRRYDVPPQDLGIRLTRMPAQPQSGFRIARVSAPPEAADQPPFAEKCW